MRRQSLYLLLLAVFLLFLPMSSDKGIIFGFQKYFRDISELSRLLLDPIFAAEPIQVRILASMYIVQLIGWICFAIALILVAIFGLIRNTSPLKAAMFLSVLVLLHGVLQVALSVALASAPVLDVIFSRFGLDLSDFMDDYDALLNSTIVPIGLIVWFILSRRAQSSKVGTTQSRIEPEVPTENF